MKRIALFTLIFLAVFSSAQIRVIQNRSGSGGGGSFTKTQTGVAGSATTGSTVLCSFASNPGAGHLVTITALFFDGGSTPASITSIKDGATPNNSYTVDPTNSGSTNMASAGQLFVGYLLDAPSNADKNITVTFSKAIGGAGACWADEWTPANLHATLVDSAAVFNSGTGTPISTPTVPVTGTADLVIAVAAASDGAGVTAATPFTANEGGQKFSNLAEWATGRSANTAVSFTNSGATGAFNAMGISFK